jgi:hypothetical protein
MSGRNKNKEFLHSQKREKERKKERKRKIIKQSSVLQTRSSFTVCFSWLFTLPSGNFVQSISFSSLAVCGIQNVLLTFNVDSHNRTSVCLLTTDLHY